MASSSAAFTIWLWAEQAVASKTINVSIFLFKLIVPKISHPAVNQG